jgi:hypothetical protein
MLDGSTWLPILIAPQTGSYPFGMKQIASGRMGQVVAKYGENAPMATVCCNACRSCVTANLVAVFSAAAASVGGGLWRVVRRKSS